MAISTRTVTLSPAVSQLEAFMASAGVSTEKDLTGRSLMLQVSLLLS